MPASTPKSNLLEWIPEGAYIELDSLIASRFAAKDLKINQRRKALNLLAGPNKSNFRGRGIDFEEVRIYQPGDDIRTIDWRVTARSNQPHTKLFSEERERPMLVVTDQRQGMFFGSHHCFKSVMACYTSALISWSALQQGDRVGGLVFGNDEQHEVRPKRNRQSTLALMHLMLELNHRLNRDSGIGVSPEQQLENCITDLRRIARPGTAIFLVSDFSGLENVNVQKHLHQLSRHCEITALFISDPMEKNLPPPGQYTVTDGQQRNQINTADRRLRASYNNHFLARENHLKSFFGKLGIPMIAIATDQPPLQKLLNYYGNRR
jgi:uncharacterized protein (DUF58 family)